jgi:hypothetical protein
MKKYFFILLSFLLIGISCSINNLFKPNYQKQFVTKEYNGKAIRNASLIVKAPAPFQVFIDNADDVADDLGEGDEGVVYLQLLQTQIIKALKGQSTFSKITYKQALKSGEYKPRAFSFAKNSLMLINMPTDGEKILFDKDSADYVLLLDSIHYCRDCGNLSDRIVFRAERTIKWSDPNAPTMTFPGGMFEKRNYLYSLYFALWDNKAGRLVSYGIVEGEISTTFGMTKSKWESSIDEIVEQIIQKSPFSKNLEIQSPPNQ